MSYLVFARKFRPQTFASVAGQEHISRALQNAIHRNRIPHALLFTGPRGVGKTTTARLVAKALNCQKIELPILNPEQISPENIEPCGECANCKEIANSSSIAVWEIDGASNNSVDHVRELIDSLRSAPPPGSRYKIYIIDEVHMLSTAAFNALLKSLEEPPANTVFIFATTEPHKIPETVISRCQRHDFRKLGTDVIVRCLKDIADTEKVKVDDAVLSLVARKAQGGMRDAQSMFDRLLAFSEGNIELQAAKKIFGVVDSSFFESLADAVFNHDTAKVFEQLDEVFAQSLDVRTFLADFVLYWRNLFVVAQANQGRQANQAAMCRMLEVTSDEYARLVEMSSRVSSFDLQRLFDLATSSADRAISSSYPRYVLEAGITKMATLSDLRPIAEIVAALESQKKNFSSAVVAPKTPQQAIKHEQASLSAQVQAAALEKEKPQVAAPVKVDAEHEEPIHFNPSWKDFVEFVKSRSEIVLSSFLRRVAVVRFDAGKLELAGSSFDAQSLSEARSQQSIKTLLYAYSGISEWHVQVTESKNGAVNAAVSSSAVAKNGNGYAENSIAAQEQKANHEREKRIDKEAREQEAVKKVLSVFGGGKVERVSVLKQS